MAASFRAATAIAHSTRSPMRLDVDPLSLGFHIFSVRYDSQTHTICGTSYVTGWVIGLWYLSNDRAPLHESIRILYLTPRGTLPSRFSLDTLGWVSIIRVRFLRFSVNISSETVFLEETFQRRQFCAWICSAIYLSHREAGVACPQVAEKKIQFSRVPGSGGIY